MAEFIRHEPCEACGSSDAKAIYDDGSTFCFSCQTVTEKMKSTKCKMYNSKEQPNDSQKEKSVKQPVSTTGSTGMENFYASLLQQRQNTSRVQNKNQIKRI